MNRKTNRAARFLVVAATVLGALPAMAAEVPVPETAAVERDIAAAKATIEAMRATGRALYAWVQDQSAAAEREGGGATGAAGTSVDWAQCPAITYEEARSLLVPAFAADLPREDGWGRPLELCLRHAAGEPEGARWIGVRSAGRDGVFEGATYRPGAFDAFDFDHDLVWLDGYFVTWPQRRE